MNVQHVTDFRSNRSDHIVNAAEFLKKSKLKQEVFKAVYFHKSKIKTVSDIQRKTGLNRIQVLQNAKLLVHEQLIHQKPDKINGDTAYEQDSAVKAVYKKILGLAKSPKNIDKIPTKTNPKKSPLKSITIKVPYNKVKKVKVKEITIDEILSFKKIKKIKRSGSVKISKMPESKFKKSILKILNEKTIFTDWGGEKNDIYTTRLKLKKDRVNAAFALKGPGQKVKRLTPKHMGKNGDQIQRLMTSAAQVFLVQYWGEIDQSVFELLYELAIAKSYAQGRTIFIGIIDGQDSERLVLAYPKAFQ